MPRLPHILFTINLRELAASAYVDPHFVYKYHWFPWNWGILSMNPVIPGWLVVVLQRKPWDWITLAEQPSSCTIRRLLRHKLVYPHHHVSPTTRFDESHPCVHKWRERCARRIVYEIYHRLVVPKRRIRWMNLVNKILNKSTSFGIKYERVNRYVASFLAPALLCQAPISCP